MKKVIFAIIMAIQLMIVSPETISAYAPNVNDAQYVTLVKESKEYKEENGGVRHRLPGKHIECLIDRNAGVQFCNGATPQFMSYEVYDMDEIPVATFLTESEFITYIFSHEGEYQIRLVAADCAYIGYVSL